MADFYKEEYDKIYSHLKKAEVDFDEIFQSELFIEVSVSWGDWKHSHIWLDHCMEQLGYHLLEENVTERDGSDCYSSIHVYMRRL
jgi:hypothetical protein